MSRPLTDESRMGLIARYRTSRGFGVHSPYAFRFITRVLRDRNAHYYATAALGRSHHDRALCRRMMRVAVALSPAAILVTGKVSEAVIDALRAADSRVDVTTDAERFGRVTDPGLIVAATDADVPSMAVTRHDVVVLDGHGCLPEGMDSGMAFHDRREHIFIRHRRLPSSHFTLRFR